MDKLLKTSPSQVKTFRRCKRLYAWQWTHGFFSESSPKQQFGTEIHAALESWLRHGRFENTYKDRKNKVCPIPIDAIDLARKAIVYPALPLPEDPIQLEHEFRMGMSGSLMRGFIDCILFAKGNFDLPEGSRALNVPVVIDHKTTSNFKWAMTPAELAVDPQAILYALFAMFYLRAPVVMARWIYYQYTWSKTSPRKARGVKHVEYLFDARDPFFIGSVKLIEKDLREMVQIRREKKHALALSPSINACGMFGGCEHTERCNLRPDQRIISHLFS